MFGGCFWHPTLWKTGYKNRIVRWKEEETKKRVGEDLFIILLLIFHISLYNCHFTLQRGVKSDMGYRKIEELEIPDGKT